MVTKIRKERNIDTVEYDDLLGLYVIDNIADKVVTKEIANRIKVLVTRKRRPYSKIINMRIQGYSYAEIGHKLKISESSARVIDFRTKVDKSHFGKGGIKMKISCDVILDLIPLVKDGVASDDSSTIVKEHIKNCESCRAEFDIFRIQ